MGWEETWGELDDAWRRAFGLAWEAFVEGSIAVGAVVLGPDGEVVAEGRNRSGAAEAPAGQLGGSFVAHAEINALGRLPLDAPEPITLLTTLEPCFLCTAACRYAHVDVVRYAAPDRLWSGVERMGELNAFFARRAPRREEVDLGPLSSWSAALALVSIVHRVARRRQVTVEVAQADDPVFAAGRRDDPAAAALAEVLLADGLAPGTGLSLEQALARWWRPMVEGGGRRG